MRETTTQENRAEIRNRAKIVGALAREAAADPRLDPNKDTLHRGARLIAEYVEDHATVMRSLLGELQRIPGEPTETEENIVGNVESIARSMKTPYGIYHVGRILAKRDARRSAVR